MKLLTSKHTCLKLALALMPLTAGLAEAQTGSQGASGSGSNPEPTVSLDSQTNLWVKSEEEEFKNLCPRIGGTYEPPAPGDKEGTCKPGGGDVTNTTIEPPATLSLQASKCKLTFGWADNNGATATKTVQLDMGKPGFAGLRLGGNVDNNDRFFLGFQCDVDRTPPTDSERYTFSDYINTCQAEMGWRDNTHSGGAAHDVPSRSTVFNSNASAWLQPGGDVDDNDSFYIRMRCAKPTGTSDLDKKKLSYFNYATNQCSIGFGHSDNNRAHVERMIWNRVTETISQSASDWGQRLVCHGDVDNNDIFFLGWYCTDTAGNQVRRMTW
jgi:hypothetical protein